jgi:hypothetical protein
VVSLAAPYVGQAPERRAAGVGGNAGARRPLILVDAVPKMTKAWRCKKRAGSTYCHTYRAGFKEFAEAVRQLRPPMQYEPWSRRWCLSDTPCAPLVLNP